MKHDDAAWQRSQILSFPCVLNYNILYIYLHVISKMTSIEYQASLWLQHWSLGGEKMKTFFLFLN